MINILTMTAQSPTSGMPAYGQTSVARVAISGSGFAGAQVSTCARVRHIGGMALATKGDFPGTNAWRPPTC